MEMDRINEEINSLRQEIAELRSGPRKSKSGRIAMAVALFFVPVLAFGVTITKPYTFTAGQPISASELNENFDVVYERVNELGMYKVMAGTTELGDLVSSLYGTNTVNFITDKGYLSGVASFNATTTQVGFLSINTSYYYSNSSCTGDPIMPYANKKIVFFDSYQSKLMYTTDTHPTTVPGYIRLYYGCSVNSQAGTQSTGDFWTTADNSESVTGMPDTVSGTVDIELK